MRPKARFNMPMPMPRDVNKGAARLPMARGPYWINADVRRMLATMKAEIFAARAIALANAAAIDLGHATGVC